MANNYKKDGDKPPVLDALLPFYPALEALAKMMDDMQHKHRLAGSADPFNEWRQLPQAKKRLANGAARHLLKGPWKTNTQDGNHLHATHALFGVLAALTVHLEDNAEACCGAPDAMEWAAKAAESTAGPAVPEPPANVVSTFRGDRPANKRPSHVAVPDPPPAHAGVIWEGREGSRVAIHGPAGADWRERPASGPCMYGRCVRTRGHEGQCEAWDGSPL